MSFFLILSCTPDDIANDTDTMDGDNTTLPANLVIMYTYTVDLKLLLRGHLSFRIKLLGFHICRIWSCRCETLFLVKENWHKIKDHGLFNVGMVL